MASSAVKHAKRDGGRFKAVVSFSSDHAGILPELERLEREMYRVLARVDDPRKLRDYLIFLRHASVNWLEENPHRAPWE